AISQIQYLAAGALGAPVFAGFRGGIGALAGPTGGYLVGFVFAAYVVGAMADRTRRGSFAGLCLAGFTGVLVIYVFGRAWLGLWLGNVSGLASWALGVAPFVAIDAVKVLAAAAICGRRAWWT
ncbi:MAG: biotin transporter BioY, partial [Armatimonadota bacterium]